MTQADDGLVAKMCIGRDIQTAPRPANLRTSSSNKGAFATVAGFALTQLERLFSPLL